jgi:hypothetical protein
VHDVSKVLPHDSSRRVMTCAQRVLGVLLYDLAVQKIRVIITILFLIRKKIRSLYCSCMYTFFLGRGPTIDCKLAIPENYSLKYGFVRSSTGHRAGDIAHNSTGLLSV